MNSLKIVFMGSPDFAVPSLEKLHTSRHQVQAVVSNPDKRRGRRSKPTPTAVKSKALELGYSTIDVENVKSKEFYNELKRIDADLYVVVAFKILPPSVLELPGKGAINLHASLLPKYRGAAPIHWAIINGEEETGCTVFFLDDKVDTGNILDRQITKIGPMETTGDLYERLKTEGADLLLKCVDSIADNNYTLTTQNHTEATKAPKLYASNTKIDFTWSAETIHNFIRGLNPFPVAWCKYDSKKMNVYRSKPVQRDTGGAPGSMHVEDNKLLVTCGDGAIEFKQLQLPGTKKMSAEEFVNGYKTDIRLK